jgi:hypothetical protein
MSTAIANLIVQVPSWGYGLLALAVLLTATYYFAPEIFKQIFEQLTGIAKQFLAILVAIAKLLFAILVAIAKFLYQFGEALWQIWGLVFALRWRFQYAVRYFFSTTTLGVLFVGAFYLCAELSVTIATVSSTTFRTCTRA